MSSTNDAPESAVPSAKEDTMIVTRTPTIGDGIVYRWFRGLGAVEHHRPVVSASRNGVMLHDGDRITNAVAYNAMLDAFSDAMFTYHELASGKDPRHLVTHEREGLTGPLSAVEYVNDMGMGGCDA